MEVHRYKAVKILSAAGNAIEYSPSGPEVVFSRDFDRILAERDALQSRLNSVEGENDRLRQLLMASREHVEFSVSYWASSDKSDQDLIESIGALEKNS